MPEISWRKIKLKVYVPSTRKNEEIPEKAFRRRIEETEKFLTKIFGGVTEEEEEGIWKREDGEVIKENVSTVEVFTSEEEWREKKDEFFNWMGEKKGEWKQESIAFEKEDDMGIIK